MSDLRIIEKTQVLTVYWVEERKSGQMTERTGPFLSKGAAHAEMARQQASVSKSEEPEK